MMAVGLGPSHVHLTQPRFALRGDARTRNTEHATAHSALTSESTSWTKRRDQGDMAPVEAPSLLSATDKSRAIHAGFFAEAEMN